MIRLRALGRCVVEIGDQRITPESDVLFALLLYVSSNAGRAVPRGDLLELLWPSSGVASARHRLRQALYQLKRLGAPLAALDASIVVAASDVEVDYLECVRSRESLVQAASRGAIEFLPRYAPTFSPAFGRWVEEERDRVHIALARRMVDAITDSRGLGQSEVFLLARACLELDPVNHEATLALAESLALMGRRGEALGLLDKYRRDHADEPDLARAGQELRRRIVDLGRSAPLLTTKTMPLVGRGELIEEICSWLADAPNSAGRIFVFTGDSGIGKTRLLSEASRVAGLRGIRCIEYRPGANGENRPLAGLLDLLPQLLSLPGAIGCSPESYRRLRQLVEGNLDRSSLPEDTTDSVFRFAALRRAVLDLINALVVENPLLLAVDDAHSLDRTTLELLFDAAECGDHALSLIVAIRPSNAHATLIASRAGVHLVKVPRLPRDQARLIVSHDLSKEAVATRSRLIEWAVDLADGNPFFLTELSVHCGTDNPRESLPDSLQIVLRRKIDGLSPTARLLVQCCGVLGNNSTMSRLEAVLDLPAHDMASALAECEHAGLITVRDGRVICRHDLITEAVNGSTPETLAAFLHRRCAVLLNQELEASPTATLAWDCARHWDAASEPVRALQVTFSITDRLLSLGLPRAAADLCEQAEGYCRTAEQRGDLLLRLSRARKLLYDWNGVIAALSQRHVILAKPGQLLERYSEDEISLFEARWWSERDKRDLRPAVRRVADLHAPSLHRLQMAVVASIVADNHSERKLAETVFRLVEGIWPATPREEIEQDKVRLIYHSAFGDLQRALIAGGRLVERERLGGSSAGLLKALRWFSVPKKWTNDAAGAIALIEESYKLASRLALRSEMWNAAYYAQNVALDCEDLALALEWAPRYEDLASESTVPAAGASSFAYFMARVEYMSGDLVRAQHFLEMAEGLQSVIPRERAEHALVSLDVLLRVKSGKRRVPKALLARLHRIHDKSATTGYKDFETAALVAGMVSTGDRTGAKQVLADYSRIRRTSLREHSSLREARRMLSHG